MNIAHPITTLSTNAVTKNGNMVYLLLIDYGNVKTNSANIAIATAANANQRQISMASLLFYCIWPKTILRQCTIWL